MLDNISELSTQEAISLLHAAWLGRAPTAAELDAWTLQHERAVSAGADPSEALDRIAEGIRLSGEATDLTKEADPANPGNFKPFDASVVLRDVYNRTFGGFPSDSVEQKIEPEIANALKNHGPLGGLVDDVAGLVDSSAVESAAERAELAADFGSIAPSGSVDYRQIQNADDPSKSPDVPFADVSAPEGAFLPGQSATFTAVLSRAAETAREIDFTLRNGSGGAAGSGTITVEAGEKSGKATVEVAADASSGDYTVDTLLPDGLTAATGGEPVVTVIRPEPEPVNTVSLDDVTATEGRSVTGTIKLDSAPDNFIAVEWKATGPDGYVQTGKDTFVAGRETTSKTFKIPAPAPDGDGTTGPDVTFEITNVESDARIEVGNGSVTTEALNTDPSGLFRGDTLGIGGSSEFDTAFRFSGGDPVLSKLRDKIATAADVALSWWDGAIDVAGESENVVFDFGATKLQKTVLAITFPRAERNARNVPGIDGTTGMTDVAKEIDTPGATNDDETDFDIAISEDFLKLVADTATTEEIRSGEHTIVSVIAHEIGHELGIAGNAGLAFTEHLKPNDAEPGKKFFTGPTVKAVNDGPLSVFEEAPSHLNNSFEGLPEKDVPIMDPVESQGITPIDAAIARDIGLKLHDDALNLDFIG